MNITDELKIYCLIRKDLDMPLGKMIAQAAHGYMGALLKAPAELKEEYLSGAFVKISKWVKNQSAIERALAECQEVGLTTCLITDSGRTVFTEPTVTVLGIGPCRRDQLPKFVDKMQLI